MGGEAGQPGEPGGQESGQNAPGQGGESSGQSAAGEGGDGSQGSASNKSGSSSQGGAPPTGGGGDGDGGGMPPAEDGEGTAGLPDPTDPEYARKASSLVHKRLKDELSRGEVDRELLDEMGYTESDLRRFADRLEERLNRQAADSEAEAARQRQFDSILERINRGAQADRRDAGSGPREAAEGFSAPARPAPPEYRRRQREYEQRILQQRRR